MISMSQPSPLYSSLSNIRVLDFGRVIVAPRCARYLAELGADVIHVERPGRGDDTRSDAYLLNDGLSGAFIQENWGKRSIAIDLNHPRAPEILKPLVESADVVLENFRPGVMSGLGLGYEQLSDINPRLIMCSISAFGQSGPHADRVGYGFVADAIAGIPELTGSPDGPPVPCPIPLADVMGSGLAFGLICAALHGRNTTGRGTYIDLSLLDAAFATHDLALQTYLSSDGLVQRRRQGSFDSDRVPWGYFQGPDGWVCIMCGTDRHWEALAALMRADGLTVPVFDGIATRQSNQSEIYCLVSKWVATSASVEDVVSAINTAKIPGARLNTIEQAVRDPQVQTRRLVETVDHPRLGSIRIPNFLGPNAEPARRQPAPLLGEQSREIAAEAGLSPADINSLIAAGCLAEHSAEGAHEL
ncbi:CoA transferase [Mesorhizobium sp.]|uniref:CaiB/BaiF CoA transferase family protein n=1 Tax=Mesorhizobium sp. TaxID=1871066 RepID=UPI0026991119